MRTLFVRSLVAGAVLLLLALPCPAEEDAATRAEVQALFGTLQQAANAGDRGAIAALFDADAMVEALERDGFLTSIPESGRENFALGLRLGMRAGMTKNDFVQPFTSFEVRGIKPGPRPGLLVVYLRSKDADGLVTKVRWHLARVGEAWRVYDFEDLDVNIRLTAILGLVLTDTLSGGKLRWADAAQKLREAQHLMVDGAYDEAYGLLGELESVQLPDVLRGVVQMLLASIDVGHGDKDAAFERFDRAAKLNPDMPIVDYLKAIAFNDRGEFEEALRHARLYIAQLDADAQVNLELGRALHGLERSAEAVAPLLSAIQESPGETETLAFLAMVLPPERGGELAVHFAKLRDPAPDFETMAELCLQHEEIDALEVLTGLFARIQPEHRDVAYYQGMVLRNRERNTEAAQRFEQALKKVAPEELQDAGWPYVEAWLDAMIAAGKAAEALERSPDRAHGFHRVAEHYAALGDAAALRKVVAQAADLQGVAEARTYYQAEVEFLEGRHDAAVRLLAPLRASLARPDRTDEGDGDAQQLLWDTEDRLVRSLVRTKQLDEALALAQAVAERDGDGSYLVIVHAHRGDVAATRKALLEEIQRGREPAHVFEDEDLAPILATAPYKDLRERLLGGG